MLQYQRVTGIMFVLLAVIIGISAVLNFQQRVVGIGIVKICITIFLVYLAWNQLQPRRNVSVPTSDERTRQEIQGASSIAFWLLIISILSESYFNILPNNIEDSLYLILGMSFLIISWIYKKSLNTK